MKQIRAILIITTCFLPSLYAQDIQNGGFENWHTVGGWYENPDHWLTNNTQIIAPGVVKDSATLFGKVAMQVMNIANLPGRAWTGITRTVHPQALSGYVKTNIMAGDSASVRILLYYQGMPVDSGIWYARNTAPWSAVNIDISQNTQNIDSVGVVVAAGTQVGTWMSADELHLEDATAVSNMQSLRWSLYPNPMAEQSILRFDNPSHAPATLVLRDVLGNIVYSKREITGGTVLLDRNDLAPGLLLFELSVQGGPKATGKLFVGL